MSKKYTKNNINITVSLEEKIEERKERVESTTVLYYLLGFAKIHIHWTNKTPSGVNYMPFS